MTDSPRGPARTKRTIRSTAPALVLVLCTAIISCAAIISGAAAADDPSYPGQRQPTAGFDGTVADPDKTVELHLETDIENGLPVAPGAFADPFVMQETDADYVYATNTTSANVPVMRITDDGKDGQYLGDAMPTLPSWTKKGFQWAPASWARPDGTFVLYYSTPAPNSDRQCISAATSDSPSGPFVDNSSTPMICPLSEGGAIDPSPFVTEDGDPYLLWKADGNCCDLATTIYSQPLSSDGLSTAGDASALVSDTQDWEKKIVEAPSMVQDGSTYWLFYSGNDWNTTDYSIGIARCSSVTGPCEKPLDTAWQSSAGSADGPGGQEFFTHSSGLRMVHHGWLPGEVDTTGSTRHLFIDVVTIDGSDLPVRDDSAADDGAVDWWPWLVGAAAVAIVVLIAFWLASRRRSADPPGG